MTAPARPLTTARVAQRVVASNPGIVCTDAKYAQWGILVFIVLAGFVIGGPAGLLVFLRWAKANGAGASSAARRSHG